MHEEGSGSGGLLDRVSERRALDALVAAVRTGQSRVLVLRGEAGSGKSALLQFLPNGADDCTILRATGVESESELAFAGLHAFCAPMLDRLEQLPEPQRDALSTAFGLHAGQPPDRFLVGLAVLSLLAESAEDKPILCIVDDAQWLDRVSTETLAFVARRLLAERIGFVFAVRDTHSVDALDGLPELLIEGLPTADARLLLDAMIPGPLDEEVKARILDEARGNPLALMELPRGLTPSEFAGGFGLPDSRPLTSRIERSFLQRVEALPRETQLLLLVAASEPLGDVALLWRAASLLGIDREAGRPAEAAGLIEFDRHVRFVHPLVRSAVYRAFPASDRRDVRRALADATDPETDPDRRAWHRAYATAVPDEDVAAEMVRSADRARARGGMAAAAAFLQRAAELTPDPTMRVERSLAAAQAKLVVADTGAAASLLEAVESAPLDDLQRARTERLRAEIVFLGRRDRDAPLLLLQAAQRLAPLDTRLARDTYLEGISSAMSAGRLGTGPDAREIAAAAALVDAIDPPRAADLLLDGLVTRFTEGYAASVAPLEHALRTMRDFDGDSEDFHWLWLSCRLATDLWDDELWFELATRGVRVARDRGALTLLPNALNHLAAFDVHAGAFAAAAALSDEVRLIVRAAGFPSLGYSRFKLASARGDRVAVQSMIDGPIAVAAERGEGQAVGTQWALVALMHNGFGQYDKALTAARHGSESDEVTAYNTALVELVEAAVRSGALDESATALDLLRTRTSAAGTPWALGVEARSRALVHSEESAYVESIEQLGRSRAAVDLARSRLVYGEWLRRENRRVDAREQLRAAHDSFSAMGADAFAERAGRELLATGETARRGDTEDLSALTPQEWQVARLARDGYTNPEIGAQLFISPRTVEYHLGKVFRKLGVTSRRGLRDALDDSGQAAAGYV